MPDACLRDGLAQVMLWLCLLRAWQRYPLQPGQSPQHRTSPDHTVVFQEAGCKGAIIKTLSRAAVGIILSGSGFPGGNCSMRGIANPFPCALPRQGSA